MIIRIDDYPTGIRPILDNHIEEFNPIFRLFEDRKLTYFLGVVPSLCDEKDWEFLNTLKYMIPSCHGYNHLYQKYSHVLRTTDPYNKMGIGGDDNEFSGLSEQETDCLISTALRLMRRNLRRKVYSFIPPFNRINHHVEPSLKKNDVTLVLGECPEMGTILTVRSSPFYIKSSEMEGLDLGKASCITLHVTWEWDLIRNNCSRLRELVEAL